MDIGFRPGKDGFPFGNRWVLDEDELKVFRDKAEAALSRLRRVLVFASPTFLALSRAFEPIATTLERVLERQTYGLCGGMAYAAADCFVHGIPIPWMEKGGKAPAAGDPLRLYLWKRQLRSFTNDLDRFVLWIVYLNWLPRWLNGGPTRLAQESRKEWVRLQSKLDGGAPVPLGLVRDTQSPFECHQVLAVGYDEPDDVHRVIEIYDPNCPMDGFSTITFLLEGKDLEAQESCAAPQALMGFFVDDYEPEDPREFLNRIPGSEPGDG